MSKNAMTIPRITSEQFVADAYFSRRLPAIVTDATGAWGMSGRWSPEFLTSLLGTKSVTVSISADGRFTYDASGKGTADGYAEETMTFAEAARQIAATDCTRQLYIMQQSIPQQFPELMSEIRVPQWGPDVAATSINLWFGRNSVTPLHYDATNNLFAQQYGEKEFLIFSPDDTARLYPHPIGSRMPHVSAVNADAPDLDAHPDFREAQPIRFTVKAGDLLFLPAFWWHQVRSPGVSTSVSIWWRPDLQQYVRCPNGTRQLYRQYETDRLSTLRSTLLASNGLGFSKAAALVLSAGRKWAACLLAVAAFDELLGGVCHSRGIARPQGCSLPNLASDLRDTLAGLVRAGVPAESLPSPSSLQQMFELAGRIASGDDARFATEEVAGIVKLAVALETSSLEAKSTAL